MAAAAMNRLGSEGRLASPVLLSEDDGPMAPFAGKYSVLRVLGQGGMGTVFEARHLRLGHRVAIKVLGSELRDYPELVARFEREARAASALSSPHAVRVLDIDLTEDGTPYIVMELLSGCDLAHVVETDGAQPIGRAVRWVLQACDAIAEAHRLGIVHRDLKPSNLFLCERGGVKVLDFGIAKRVAAKEASITQGVAPLGTPQYMSPEQVRCAKDVDARTDIWSLGVTLYELITGRTPFAHVESSACIAAIAADPVPDPRTFREDIPEELVDVILQALEKNPNDRPASIEELVRALAPFADADEECESAVHRVLDAEARALSQEQDTIGEDEGSAPRHGPESVAIPLVVSRPSVPKKARWRAPLAFGTATVLGLAALVLTPRCVSRIDTPSTSVVQASAPANTAAPEPAPSSVVAPVNVAPETVEVAETVDLDAVEPAAPPLMAKPAVVKKPMAPSKPVRTDVVTDSHVHGGLSSPGF